MKLFFVSMNPLFLVKFLEAGEFVFGEEVSSFFVGELFPKEKEEKRLCICLTVGFDE
jgi:hypothetical protein